MLTVGLKGSDQQRTSDHTPNYALLYEKYLALSREIIELLGIIPGDGRNKFRRMARKMEGGRVSEAYYARIAIPPCRFIVCERSRTKF